MHGVNRCRVNGSVCSPTQSRQRGRIRTRTPRTRETVSAGERDRGDRGRDRPARGGGPRRRQQLATPPRRLPQAGRRHRDQPVLRPAPKSRQWLRDQGKLAEVPLRERVWQQLAGHPAGAVTALVHAGCALLLVRDRPTAWLEITAVSDERMATAAALALNDLLTARFGPATEAGDGSGGGTSGCVRAVHTPTADELLPSVPLLRAAAELAAETGRPPGLRVPARPPARRQPAPVHPHPAGPRRADGRPRGAGSRPARTVLDPAYGTGALLRALSRPTALYAQDADPDLAALTALRLALNATIESCTVAVRAGDTLRADAFPQLAVDAVLCHPPFNERNWGHDELAYDPRWEYGFPARTESELAWVQHALAHLREGGTAVLLMPPGRRVPPLRPSDPCRSAAPRRPACRRRPARPAPHPRTASRSTSGCCASPAPVSAPRPSCCSWTPPSRPNRLRRPLPRPRRAGATGSTGRRCAAPCWTPGSRSTGRSGPVPSRTPSAEPARTGRVSAGSSPSSNSSTTTWTWPPPAICRPPTAGGGRRRTRRAYGTG